MLVGAMLPGKVNTTTVILALLFLVVGVFGLVFLH